MDLQYLPVGSQNDRGGSRQDINNRRRSPSRYRDGISESEITERVVKRTAKGRSERERK